MVPRARRPIDEHGGGRTGESLAKTGTNKPSKKQCSTNLWQSCVQEYVYSMAAWSIIFYGLSCHPIFCKVGMCNWV